MLIRKLAGGVAHESDACVLGGDAAAVIRDTDISGAAVADLNADVLRAGVERVFNELLDYGGRTFHHLTGGDQICDMRGQYVYYGHRKALRKYSCD